jgi:hypothetical protein
MSAPYVAACLMACLIALVFCIVWKMGKLGKLRVTVQIPKFFSLSIDATSDSRDRMIDDGDGHRGS